ncbi:hypothetical protein GWI33_002109 [Rhynchophorus ferrugineus]|uniref:WD repeat-containing protein 13-like protein n=1 Tax=Rhynchophorus ferrugineus TaxID=354439 RepID=A0A834IRH1_RHYFE|nr:hypothetical protein GWI33_002109 [Rhynchophorus ferrugineus]
MTTALQQQVFALDARYNALRAPENPSIRTQYIRRRSQLLRETKRNLDQWKQYTKLRSMLLQKHYGNAKIDSESRSLSKTSILTENQTPVNQSSTTVIPTKQAVASKAIVGGNSIAENYAFSGVHHIFDQHAKAVTMVKFANNDRTKLCCSSGDCNLSICDVISEPPAVLAILKGHKKLVTAFDWSINNDLIASVSLDATIRLWKTNDFSCLRTLKEPNNSQILCCMFQTSNNNLILTGNCRVGGNVLCITSDNDGKILWAGNSKGEIVSISCELNGALCILRRFSYDSNCCVTNLSYRTWVSREARDPTLLVNATNNTVTLLLVNDNQGGVRCRRVFKNRHTKHMIKSTFCPIMSFREGACVVSGSEDGSVYFIDVEKTGPKAIVNTLQGHARTVLSVSFNYDESLLATSDLDGLVIIWKRGNVVQ